MSVAEIGQLHSRYVRLSDKFKAGWTYHQFASGVFKNLLKKDLPYEIDFQSIYDDIKRACDVIQSAASTSAGPMMDRCDTRLDAALAELLQADEVVSPSVLRRFFEGLRRQDEKILFNVIKFYLYAGAIEGGYRDKLDFLLTRVGEDFVEERGEYSPKDTLELRKQFQSLLSVRAPSSRSQDEIIRFIRDLRQVREAIQKVATFEDLTKANLLNRAREVKEELGELYFHPDVLLAIVECNITAKNKFAKLYQEEEARILDDSRRLLENEEKIARGFGEANPDLLEEMQRFKEAKQEFDDSRARQNVKHAVISRLKASMNNILAELDRGLESAAEVESISSDFLMDVQHDDMVHRIFGEDPMLHAHLVSMIAALEASDPGSDPERLAGDLRFAKLRLEPWEIGALQQVASASGSRATDSDEDDMQILFLRAAALRMKIDDEAQALASIPRSDHAPRQLLDGVKASLDRAKELDQSFKNALQDGLRLSNSKTLHRLYRSRLRLLRGFSGLWLIYDLRASGD